MWSCEWCSCSHSDTNGVRAPGPRCDDSLCAACGIVYAQQASTRASKEAETELARRAKEEIVAKEQHAQKERAEAAEAEALRLMQEMRTRALADLDDDLDLSMSDGSDQSDDNWLIED